MACLARRDGSRQPVLYCTIVLTNPSLRRGDWTALAPARLDGVQLLTARFRKHHYGRHAHDAYVLAVLDDGAQAFSYRGERCVARTGDVVILAPGEAHDGRPHDADGYHYRTLHIDPAWFADDHGALPEFPAAIIRDNRVRHRLSAFCDQLVRSESVPETLTEALEGLLAALQERHAVGRAGTSDGSTRAARALAEMARERLLRSEHPAGSTVGAVALEFGVSRGHLSRVFLRAYGLPPHAWLLQRRLARAFTLLRSGVPLAGVAASAGFADQSHFTRRFKAVYGFTPGLVRSTRGPA